jgi:hypothetical protein
MDHARSNINHLRGRRSINQVATAAGIQQSWLQRFMNPDRPDGIKKANPEKLGPVATLLGVSLADLLYRDLVHDPIRAESQLARDEAAMIRAVMRIMDHIRESAIEPINQEQRDRLETHAIEVVAEFGPERILEGDLLEAVREVATRMRSK